jgi:hypothetical protein
MDHRVFLETLIVAQFFNKFSVCLLTEGSLPCSQERDTGSYSEPDESTPQLL